MDEALMIFSRTKRALLEDTIKATEIKSRADMRKYWPFADSDHNRVYWVNWGHFKESGRPRRAHFSHYPKGKNHPLVEKDIRNEIEQSITVRRDNPKHKMVQNFIVKYLDTKIKKGERINWYFKDDKISQFPLSGNLLSDVKRVEKEYGVHSPFGDKYYLDIALLGDTIHLGDNFYTEPQVLGAIEIEFSYEFELSKCLFCKASGFPLLSLDISQASENEITEDWCITRLLETTKSSEDNFRRNYIYIHDLLYPVYMDIPQAIVREKTHQYIIFIKQMYYDKLFDLLKQLRGSLSISEKEVIVMKVNCENEQNKRMIENEGRIAGKDWHKYNNYRYIRVVLNKPFSKSGAIYRFHLSMAFLLNCYFDTLVGYKYEKGVSNDDPDEPIWKKWVRADEGGIRQINLLPKHVSEPVNLIMSALKALK